MGQRPQVGKSESGPVGSAPAPNFSLSHFPTFRLSLWPRRAVTQPRWWLPLVLCGSLALRAAEPAVLPPTSATPAPIASATNPVVLPFEIRRGHVMVPAKVNGSNSLSLLLDTGY